MMRCVFAAAGSALLLCVVGCSSQPQIQEVRARVTHIDLQGVDLAFEVDVSNPYPISVRPPNYRYAVDIASAEFVKGGPLEATSDLPAAGVGTIIVPARVEYVQLWQAYQNLKDSPEAPYKLHGALAIAVMGQNYEVPFAHEGSFPVLRPPGLSVKNVRTPETSLSSVSVQVEAEIKNPNVFAIGVDGLGYSLRLGEIAVGNVVAATPGSIEAGQTGALTLTGKVTGLEAVQQLLSGQKLGAASLTASGSIQTPYGSVELSR